MKKLRILCLILCLSILCGSLCVFAENGNSMDLTVLEGSHTLDGVRPYFNSSVVIKNAQAALLYEVSTDTLLYAVGADTPMHPVSLTKILTALLCLENCKMSDVVTVKQSTLNTLPHDAAMVDLVADEVISVEELLYCMMVDSANDAAAVLAEHTFGSQEAFVQQMNLRAAALGCTNTTFTNVHGLMDDAQRSTARDLAKILKAAMENEEFCTIFGTKYHTVPATNKSAERKLTTGNYLMTRDAIQVYYDSRVTGGRTGVVASGDRSIAVSAENNGLQMICVVLGSESKIRDDGYTVDKFGGFQEVSELLNYGFNGMGATQLLYEGQPLRQYGVENGECDLIVGPRADVRTVLPQNISSSDLTYRYGEIHSGLSAPIAVGQEITTVEIYYNDICLAQEPLYAQNPVRVASAQNTEGTGGGAGGAGRVILVILIVVALLMLARPVSRYVRKMRRRAKRKNPARSTQRRRG